MLQTVAIAVQKEDCILEHGHTESVVVLAGYNTFRKLIFRCVVRE